MKEYENGLKEPKKGEEDIKYKGYTIWYDDKYANAYLITDDDGDDVTPGHTFKSVKDAMNEIDNGVAFPIFKYPDPSEVYSFGVYFIDKDGDELCSVGDCGYDYETNYSTQEEAEEAVKNILKDTKVKNDDEIAGCHIVIIPRIGYDLDDGPEARDIWYSMFPFFDPYNVTAVIWKSEVN